MGLKLQNIIMCLCLFYSFKALSQDNKKVKIKPKKEHRSFFDKFSSKATEGFSHTDFPLSIKSESYTTGSDGIFGIAIDFRVSYPNSKDTTWTQKSMQNFIRFISIGVNALSERYIVNPNQWTLKREDSSINYLISLESNWSPTVRYGKYPSTFAKQIVETDKAPDSAYEYRWRFFGNVINENKDMQSFTCQINIEIQRKSYFSTDFKPLKKIKQKDSVRDDIKSIITYSYNKYFDELKKQ